MPLAGTYIILKNQKKIIRKEVKRNIIKGIDQEQLVLLKFHKKEIFNLLRWEHSKEFEYNGEMYDIVNTENKGDSVYYYCWWDYKETALNKELRELTMSALEKDKRSNEQKKLLRNYYKSLFVSFTIYHIKPDSILKKRDTIFPSLLYTNPSYKPSEPPPKSQNRIV